MLPSAAVLTNGMYRLGNAKTAHGLIRGTERYRICAVVDAVEAGHDAGELLDGVHRGIPIVASLADVVAIEKPDYFILGIATKGGVLPEAMRPLLLEAIEHGMSLVSGLHDYLSNDPEFQAAAEKHGVELVDVRKPKRFQDLHFWTGAVRDLPSTRVAVLGTDCALGKRTTARMLRDACREQGLTAEMIYTGQTGFLQDAGFGFVLDSTLNDFVCGELEHAMVSCYKAKEPQVMLIEGQSALRNPSGPCGAELILGGDARSVVLVHPPARSAFIGFESLDCPLPTVQEEAALIAHYGGKVIGVALNSEGIELEPLREIQRQIEADMGVPVVSPLHDGCARLAEAVAAQRKDQ